MTSSHPTDPHHKHLAQQQRQLCIALLEKIIKSCYRMFRNPSLSIANILKKLSILLTKLNQLGPVYLDTQYHKETRTYIERLPMLLHSAQDATIIKIQQITELNRLQKLKNSTQYKRVKKVASQSFFGV
jgi:hypothetical protein